MNDELVAAAGGGRPAQRSRSRRPRPTSAFIHHQPSAEALRDIAYYDGKDADPAAVAHLSCGLIHLGEIAYRTGCLLKFDPKGETFPGDKEATGLLTREYRKPWDLPG